MNIYEKMLAITTELNAVAKNLKVGEGRSSYKAVGEADVLAAVKPLEAKYKVYSYPFSRHIVDRDVIVKKSSYNGQDKETSQFFMRVETVFRFVNTEDPSEYVDVTTYGDGVDSNDKAPGKAMTYGDKYALLKAYKIITGDDPDQKISEDGSISKVGGYVGGESIVGCADCGQAIVRNVKRDGSVWEAEDIVGYSKKRFGRALCPECQRAAFNAEKAAKG